MPNNNVSDPPAVQQQLTEQDTGEPRRFSVGRDLVLKRLWEIANMEPERTRSSMSAQVKAISMIVAIEGLNPDRRAVSARNQPAAPPPDHVGFYKSAWLRKQGEENSGDTQPAPAPVQEQTEPTPEPLDASQTASSSQPSRSSWVPDTGLPFK